MNILDYLTNNEKKRVKYLNIKKGNTLFKEEEICSYLGVVVSGSLVISSFSYNGKEIIYNEIKSNNVFGNNLLFSKEPYYRGDVIALENSHIALIDKGSLLFILQSNQKFLEEYLKLNAEFSKNLNVKIKILSIQSAKERFLYYLFINGNKIKYTSISSLSKLINLERETLSRVVSKLVKEKKIEKKNHFIKVIS